MSKFLRYSPLLLIVAAFAVFWSTSARPEPVLVLAYHRVSSDVTGPVPAVTPADFARQVAYLAGAGYKSVTPSQLEAYLGHRGQLPPRAVLFTFDDGWQDNFSEAWPILSAKGFVATVFVVSGRIGREKSLSARELRLLARAGWTIGAHTINHRHLPVLPSAEAEREITGSQQALARLLGRAVTCFAYPYGDTSQDVRALLIRNHLTLGFGTVLGRPEPGDDPLRIKRLTMPRRGGRFLLYLATAPWLRSGRMLLSWLLGAPPVVRAQEAYSRRLWLRPSPPLRSSLPPQK